MNVYKVPVKGYFEVNSYFLIDEDTGHGFLIDPGAQGAALVQIIRSKVWTIEKILLTHGHFDHTGGIEAIRRELDIPVYIHENGADYLEDTRLNLSEYRITGKNGIEIDPEQAKVVREMYARIIRGDTLTSIVRWLNRNGHLGAFGGKWTAGQLRAALSNEKYMGHSLLQKKYRINHIDKTLVSNQGELPQYYATETHPAIVDEATFDAAQQALERIAAQKPASKPWEHHIFTGMIICSACGKPYRHVKNHGKSRWACPTYIMEGKAFCESKQIPEEIIMRMACDLLGWNSFDEEAFKEAVDHVTAVYPHILIFHLRDGREETLEWQNRSRAESWTPEMKEKAREKARRKNDGKNSD